MSTDTTQSPMDLLIDEIHQLIIDSPNRLNAHQIAKKIGKSVMLVLHCTTVLRGSNKILINKNMTYKDVKAKQYKHGKRVTYKSNAEIRKQKLGE